MSDISCACGDYFATAIAFKRMSPEEKRKLIRAINTCSTCAKDKNKK